MCIECSVLDLQSSPQLLALEFSNRALDILSNISALLSPPRAPGVQAPLAGVVLGKFGEARTHKTLMRLAEQLQIRATNTSKTSATPEAPDISGTSNIPRQSKGDTQKFQPSLTTFHRSLTASCNSCRRTLS